MEPSSRIAFNYPIYALDVLPDDRLAVAGGGGLMKSGIPNKCAVLSFHPHSASLSEQASVDLPDAVVALATSGSTLHTVMGPGVKNFSSTENKLTPHSSFSHDLRVSATQNQSAIAVSEDSSILIVASDEGHVVSVSLPRYEKLFSAHLHKQGVTDLVISQDGSLVATTGRDRAAYIWTSHSGRVVQALKPVMPSALRTHIRAIRFCKTQPNIIFTAESNPRTGGWVAAWEKRYHTHATTYTPIATFKASADAITACAVNRGGSLVAVSSSEGHVALLRWHGSSFSSLWSTETKTDWISVPRPPHVLPVTAMRFSKSDEYFFTASADYTVAVWSIRRARTWPRVTRVSFWLLSLFICLFAVLVAEDNHLPVSVRYHRGLLQPHLEPYISKFQGSVRPFLRDRHAQIQPYISDLQRAIEPHLRQAGERIRPYTDKARKHRSRWLSSLQNFCNRFLRDRNYVTSLTSPSTMKDHQEIREPSDEYKAKEDRLAPRTRETSLALEANYRQQEILGERLAATEESIHEAGTTRSTSKAEHQNSLEDAKYSNLPRPRGRRKKPSNRESTSPRRKDHYSTRNGNFCDRNASLSRLTRRRFLTPTANQGKSPRSVDLSRNLASAKQDDTGPRSEVKTSKGLKSENREEIDGQVYMAASKPFRENQDDLSPIQGFLNIPRTSTANTGKKLERTKTMDEQQAQSLLTENHCQDDANFFQREHRTYGRDADAGDPNGDLSQEKFGAHLSVSSHEEDSRARRAEIFTKRLVVEGESDKETQTEPMAQHTSGKFGNQELPVGSITNGIALGEEVLYDVSRKINLIVSESSRTVTSIPQSEDEASGSFASSEGTVDRNRVPSRQ